MTGVVLQFDFSRKGPRNWTNQELAELYRVADLMGQAGLAVETDHGLSDEGDPWFVFCRTDSGDVIAHFAHVDGLFVAVSAVTERVFKGTSFRDIVGQLTHGQPLVVPRKPDTSKLFLHPSVVLAAFVATAYMALSAGDGEAAAAASDDDAVLPALSDAAGPRAAGVRDDGAKSWLASAAEAVSKAFQSAPASEGRLAAEVSTGSSVAQAVIASSMMVLIASTVEARGSTHDLAAPMVEDGDGVALTELPPEAGGAEAVAEAPVEEADIAAEAAAGQEQPTPVTEADAPVTEAEAGAIVVAARVDPLLPDGAAVDPGNDVAVDVPTLDAAALSADVPPVVEVAVDAPVVPEASGDVLAALDTVAPVITLDLVPSVVSARYGGVDFVALAPLEGLGDRVRYDDERPALPPQGVDPAGGRDVVVGGGGDDFLDIDPPVIDTPTVPVGAGDDPVSPASPLYVPILASANEGQVTTVVLNSAADAAPEAVLFDTGQVRIEGFEVGRDKFLIAGDLVASQDEAFVIDGADGVSLYFTDGSSVTFVGLALTDLWA